MKNLSYSVLDFGAVPGLDTLQTPALQAAIDHCFLCGGGTVTVPAGIYLTGDLRIRSHVTLYLCSGAVIRGSRDPGDYFNHLDDTLEPIPDDLRTPLLYAECMAMPPDYEYQEVNPRYDYRRKAASAWNNALIRAIGAHDFKIIGEPGAIFDGNNVFDPTGEEDYRGPHGMTLYGCRDFELRGYTIENTGNWAHNILFSENIAVKDITVNAGHDGIDLFTCVNASVTGCQFYTGDDSLAGYGNVNVYVKDCIMNSSCSAMRFGGTNMLVRDCHIYGPGKYSFRGSLSRDQKKAGVPSPTDSGRKNMLSLFTFYSGCSTKVPELPGNIVITDCRVENADRFLHYNFSGSEYWQSGYPMKDITFRNITATNVAMPLVAYGDEKEKFRLTLSHVNISLREGCEDIALIHACNYEKIALEDVTVSNYKGDHLITAWSEGDIEIKNLTCPSTPATVKEAEEAFSCVGI